MRGQRWTSEMTEIQRAEMTGKKEMIGGPFFIERLSRMAAQLPFPNNFHVLTIK